MNPPRIRYGSKSHKILEFLKTGPKRHNEIARFLGLEEKNIKLDYDKLKKDFEKGDRKSPPRNTIKVFPGLSVVLHNMSRRRYLNNYDNEDEFMDECKPLIIFDAENKLWYITEFGLDALEKVRTKKFKKV